MTKTAKKSRFSFYTYCKLLKDPVCAPEQLECVDNSHQKAKCIKPCNGMMIRSYSKSDFNGKLKKDIVALITAYRNYKKYVRYPFIIKGINKEQQTTDFKIYHKNHELIFRL